MFIYTRTELCSVTWNNHALVFFLSLYLYIVIYPKTLHYMIVNILSIILSYGCLFSSSFMNTLWVCHHCYCVLSYDTLWKLFKYIIHTMSYKNCNVWYNNIYLQWITSLKFHNDDTTLIISIMLMVNNILQFS